MYDIAIIGAGPAGISAALTLWAKNIPFLWFGSHSPSQKVQKAELIRNYPGLSLVSGADFARRLRQQVAEAGLEIREQTVTNVFRMGETYHILCNQEEFQTRAVLLATGVESVRPIPGELEFLGRGVSYCATCDGLIYRGKTIGVICTDKGQEHEIAYLASLAKEVYLCPRYAPVEVHGDNIHVVEGRPQAVTGGEAVQAMQVAGQSYPVDGVFLLKSAISPSILVPGLAAAEGHVAVERDMSTNLPGCFAAGDCTGRPYQYAKAVGEGNVAAHTAASFLRAAGK